MNSRPLTTSDISALREISGLAEAEGFRFVTRLLEDLGAGRIRLDAKCEFSLTTLHDDRRAASCYELLRLRTDTPAAAAFYERLGYQAVTSESATHHRVLRHG